jgi:diguanylate cyclase (GGDEF)-like protein/hemerythrin-like metal-binding protein/PAS domain S-box-containing protein
VFVLALAGVLVVARVVHLSRRLRREEHARGAAEETLRGLLEQPTIGICVIQQGRFTRVNSRFAEIFGLGADALTGGMGLDSLATEADREKVREAARRFGSGDDGVEVFFSAVRGDGTPVEVRLNAREVDLHGSPALVGMALDVTEQVRAQRQLQYLAFYDPLTELPNRALFYDRLGQALVQAKRDRKPFALLVLDLDGFKEVNDRHGHETGDALLKAVARRLRLCVRESDTVARIGGDEFVVLLPGLRHTEAASSVAGKILDALKEPFRFGKKECRVGASIGICVGPEDGDDMETLLGRADAAMYESKAAGKNRATRHRAARTGSGALRMLHLDLGPELGTGVPEIDAQHARMAELLNDVADAVNRGQDRDHVTALLDELLAFTRHHFETEQRLMERHRYPDLLAHTQEHSRLLADLISIRTRADVASLMLTLQSLKEWLVAHIAHGDRELGEALVASAAAPAPDTPRPADA